MKDELNSIIEKIKLGMKEAYKDTFLFTGDPTNKFGAEYLFTVNVAQAIGKLNGPNGEPYHIHIEEKTKDVVQNCLPIIKSDKGQGFVARTKPIFRW